MVLQLSLHGSELARDVYHQELAISGMSIPECNTRPERQAANVEARDYHGQQDENKRPELSAISHFKDMLSRVAQFHMTFVDGRGASRACLKTTEIG